jgi:hypothetical protein
LLQAAKAKKRTHFVTFATKAPEIEAEEERHSYDGATTESLFMQKAPQYCVRCITAVRKFRVAMVTKRRELPNFMIVRYVTGNDRVVT